jgi:hypothetical protein
VRLAWAGGDGERITGLVGALDALDTNGRETVLESPLWITAADDRPAPMMTRTGWLGARAGPGPTSPTAKTEARRGLRRGDLTIGL